MWKCLIVLTYLSEPLRKQNNVPINHNRRYYDRNNIVAQIYGYDNDHSGRISRYYYNGQNFNTSYSNSTRYGLNRIYNNVAEMYKTFFIVVPVKKLITRGSGFLN